MSFVIGQMAILCMVIPRVVPIPIPHARLVINSWINQCNPTENEQLHELRSSLNLYGTNTSSTGVGCIALVANGNIHALALMETSSSGVTLCSMNSKDLHSGTFLMHTVLKTTPELCLSPHIPQRWKIAKLFLSA